MASEAAWSSSGGMAIHLVFSPMKTTDRIRIGVEDCKHQSSEMSIKLAKAAQEERGNRPGDVNAEKMTHSFSACPDGLTRERQHPSPPHREVLPLLGAHCQRAGV